MTRKPLPLWQDGLPQCHGHHCPHWLDVDIAVSEVFIPHSWWTRFLLRVVKLGSTWSRKKVVRPGGACNLTKAMVEGICEPVIDELVQVARAVRMLNEDNPLQWYNATGDKERKFEVIETMAHKALSNYFI